MDRVRFKLLTCCLSSKMLFICCFLTAVSAVLFQSCELEPNVPEKSIRAQILNEKGYPCEINYTNIISASSNEYPAVMPDINGFCGLNIKEIPYDFNILTYDRFDENYIFSYLFKNLTGSNPVFVLKPSLFNGYFSTCDINVRFPMISEERIGIIKFISKDFFTQDNGETIIVPEKSEIVHVRLYLPLLNNSISGKLLFFECKGVLNDGIKIDQFDKYGSKDISINSEEVKLITFDSADVSFNPAESTVKYNITLPQFVYFSTVNVKLNFGGCNAASCMTIQSGNSNPAQMQSTVPASLDISFSVRVTSEFPFYSPDFSNFKSCDIQPGSSCKIANELLNPLSPADNQTDINLESMFEVSSNSENGIYLFYIRCFKNHSFTEFHVATDKKRFKLSEINCRAFKFQPNTSYAWYAVKLVGFESMDEFTAQPFFNNVKWTSASISEPRGFTTGKW